MRMIVVIQRIRIFTNPTSVTMMVTMVFHLIVQSNTIALSQSQQNFCS